MSRPVRVRFAPSPTGPLHIGGVRTALFNYLFAKKNNGVFYLRIEDTDQNRFVPGAEQYIFEALEWLGISPSETVGKNEKFGPYRQSERKHLYKQYADQLIHSGWAYYAFDTPEALDVHRKQHEEQGKTFIYNWHNREKLDTSLVISDEETNKRIAAGEDFVIRFKTPVNEVLELKDIIRGDIKFDTNLLDDKVLFKSDGMPTYHLANIVDDHLMETSHVIRGEEWLPSLPLHHLLYKAFGWEAPEFAHLPLILKPNGKGKLSKRDGEIGGFPVFPLQWKDLKGFKEEGYFPEALINMLVMLGWNEGSGIEKEIYSLKELESKFLLENVTKSGGKFNPEKAKWYNQQYLQLEDNEVLALIFKEILSEKNITVSDYKLKKIIELTKERAVFINDFWEINNYIFQRPMSYDNKALEKNWKENTAFLMINLLDILEKINEFKQSEIEREVKDWIKNNQYSFGQIMAPFRISLVGELKGIDLFVLCELIGKKEVIERIENVIKLNELK
ncbi:glutamate--tRNA ligase [Flavobacterium sp.]|jgi:glutamyl-tRNA synthetase|uniref:glutamate--tRNA ligase n=1 Tax=Flavobacterium sp. TaxID=239 RepID=UPI0037C10651